MSRRWALRWMVAGVMSTTLSLSALAQSPGTETPTPTPPCAGLACSGKCAVCPPCTPGTICPQSCVLGQCEEVSGGCACVPEVSTPAATPTSMQPVAGAVGCVYVANLRSNSVSVIDPRTNTVTATIPVGDNPDGIAVSGDGNLTYVTNFLSNDVSVIDNATKRVRATIPVGVGPVGVATLSPVKPLLYVADKLEHTVAVIDTTTNTVTTKIAVSGIPEGVAMSNDFVYVTNSLPPGGEGEVLVIGTGSNTVVATIPVGVSPTRIALSPRDAFAYVTNFHSFSLSVIDTTTNTVSGTIDLNLKPSAIAITPDDRFAYLGSFGSFSVSGMRTRRRHSPADCRLPGARCEQRPARLCCRLHDGSGLRRWQSVQPGHLCPERVRA